MSKHSFQPTGGRGFEPVPKARFRVETEAGVERIVIPAPRHWFLLPFLSVWLVGWSAGGIGAISEIFRGHDVGFLSLWLIGWALGMLFAGALVGWQLTGKEFLSIEHGALVRGWSMLGLKRQKRYDLAEVRSLTSSAQPFPFAMMTPGTPPFLPMTNGAVKWSYGAKTVHAGAGLTEAEGEMIVERLKARLPASAR